MHHIGAILLQLIRKDGHGPDIAVFHKRLRILAFRRVIETAVGVHAIRTVLQHSHADYVFHVSVVMVPHQRYDLSVLTCKCTGTDNSSVSTQNVILCSVATEIVIKCHLECVHSFTS